MSQFKLLALVVQKLCIIHKIFHLYRFFSLNVRRSE